MEEEVENVIVNNQNEHVNEDQESVHSAHNGLFERVNVLVARAGRLEVPSPQFIDLLHGLLRRAHQELTNELDFDNIAALDQVLEKIAQVDAQTQRLETELIKRINNRRAQAVPTDIIERVLGNANVVAPPPEAMVRVTVAMAARAANPIINERPTPADLQQEQIREIDPIPEDAEIAAAVVPNVQIAEVQPERIVARGANDLPPLLPLMQAQARPASAGSIRSGSSGASARTGFSVTTAMAARAQERSGHEAGLCASNLAEHEQTLEIEQGVNCSMANGIQTLTS